MGYLQYDTTRYKVQKDSLLFKINREYISLRYNYLKHMDSLFTNPAVVRSILRGSKENYRVNLDSNTIAVVLTLDSISAYKRKLVILKKKEEIYRLLEMSSFLEDIIFYPVYLVSDIWERYRK